MWMTLTATGQRPRPDEGCEAFEPAIAALADGVVSRDERERLSRHLAGCAACREVTSKLTLFRAELDGVPEPEIAPAHDPRSPSWLSAPPRTDPSLAGEVVSALVPPRSRRVVWALELVLAAVIAGIVGHCGAGASRRDAVAPGDRDPQGELGERARLAEERARLAEERARLAEERVKSAELREEMAREVGAALPGAAAPRSSGQRSAATAPVASVAPPSPSLEPPSQSPGEPGFLTVVCSPFCEDVADNGRSLGPSPIVRLAVVPGAHRITLRRGDDTKVISVQVVAGQVTAQRVQMK
jgi:hypothetical protein